MPRRLESCVLLLRTWLVHTNAASAPAYVFSYLPSLSPFDFILSLSTFYPSFDFLQPPPTHVFLQRPFWNSFIVQTSIDPTFACVRITLKYSDSR